MAFPSRSYRAPKFERSGMLLNCVMWFAGFTHVSCLLCESPAGIVEVGQMLDRSRQYLLSLIMGTPKSSCSNSAPHFQPLGSLIYFAWHFSMPWRVSRARDQRGQNRQNAPMLWPGMGVAYAPCFFSLMHPDIFYSFWNVTKHREFSCNLKKSFFSRLCTLAPSSLRLGSLLHPGHLLQVRKCDLCEVTSVMLSMLGRSIFLKSLPRPFACCFETSSSSTFDAML